MNVLISWSGLKSRSIATILRTSLEETFPDVKVWMSDVDLPLGSNWSYTSAMALDNTQFGIICLTRENVASPWILFEAGAISKALGDARVVPYLIDLNSKDITGPLAQFQCVRANRDGTLRLFSEIRASLGGGQRDIRPVFESVWARISHALFWREYDFSVGQIHRVPMRIMNGNREPEEVPGWLLRVAQSEYVLDFDFKGVAWENEIVVFAFSSAFPDTESWIRVRNCRSHTDARSATLKFSESTILFIASFSKEGPPNPFLPWHANYPVDADFRERDLTFSFEDRASGVARLALRPIDTSVVEWFEVARL
jgi:hypothetical protein